MVPGATLGDLAHPHSVPQTRATLIIRPTIPFPTYSNDPVGEVRMAKIRSEKIHRGKYFVIILKKTKSFREIPYTKYSI